jgi:hypothetical protein
METVNTITREYLSKKTISAYRQQIFHMWVMKTE